MREKTSVSLASESTRNPRKGPASVAHCRVLVIARDPMGGELLASALSKERMCGVVTAVFSDALRELSRGQVDVAVIAWDSHNSANGGLDLSREISKAFPDVRIVIVADQTTKMTVINAFRAGARGIVSRERPLAELFDCIVQVGKGHLWTSASDSCFLIELLRSIPAVNRISDLYSALTVRELQVVRSAAAGMTNKKIAEELGLSDHTVKNYMFKAFEKLGISSRVELLFSLSLGGQAVDRVRSERTEASSAVDSVQRRNVS